MPRGPRCDPACKISFAALGRVLGRARQPGLMFTRLSRER